MTINRPKNIASLEEEIAALEAQEGVVNEEKQETVQPAPQEPTQPTTPEEGNWQKRYGDLRKLDQKKADEIKTLRAEIEALKAKPQNSPLNAESVKKWVQENPQAAAVIKALALDEVGPKFKEVEALQEQVRQDKDRVRVLKAHPDFDEIVNSDEFHSWADKQPKRVQDLIYGSDADDAIWAVGAFKEATAKGDNGKNAATVIKKGSATEPKGAEGGKYLRESEIEAMSLSEYEKRQDEIAEAQKSGRIIYDLSGAAR